jgi:hypothetical protein
LRWIIRATTVALFFGAAAPAVAAPAVVDVRIEGATRTLFEGPVRTDGHAIRSASDTTDRRCDGTNNGANPESGPTATAASVDAMTISGRDFDAEWYPGFDDYFLTRFGPDAESDDTYAWWGILVDDVFTSIGGCQYRVADGDRVLWAYDAFSGRRFLKLGGPAAAEAGAPFSVTVVDTGGAPVQGAIVAPVSTDAGGDQTVLTGSPDAATTGADGTATVRFAAAGWHRLKAAGDGLVRSNRLDVCVARCGPAPADTLVRAVAAPTPSPTPTATATAIASPEITPAAVAPTPEPVPAPPLRVTAPWITTAGDRRGLIEVRWQIAGPGPGLRGWTLDSARAGTTTWTRRAAGGAARSAAAAVASSAGTARSAAAAESSALLRLPAGRSYDLRFTATDVLGRVWTLAAGRVVVPLDDRSLGLGRAWTRASSPTAWRGTLSYGARGASFSVRLAAGRPVVRVRGSHAGTRVRLGTRTYSVSAATRTITGARRPAGGRAELRVLAGRLGVDGVAVAP